MVKVRLRKTYSFDIKDTSLKGETGNLVVWWYGPVTKNRRAGSVPRVVVFFRRIDENGNLGEIIRRETALTHLGLLRIGSIWREGVSNSRIDLQSEVFDVSFSADGWKIVSPYDAVRLERSPNPIPPSEYPLYFPLDKNRLLDFSLPDGRNLLIPCMEFFVRCYGRSAEVKRVLATYPWDEAQKRLFKPIEEPVSPGSWPVKLARRLYNDDVIFLAHAIHDPYARRTVKSVYAQIEAAFRTNEPYAFLKIAPWFQGDAKLSVAGIPINNGQTFLGLSILGGSHPQGETILRDRENTNKTDGAELPSADESGTKDGFLARVMRKQPDIIDLTDDDEPDHGSSSLEIEEDDFVVLGEPRVVIDVRRARQGSATASSTRKGDESAFSTGEPYGSGKGVGHASIHANALMESHGVLRDMWNALRHLRKARPNVIQSTEWFTFEDGFSNNPEPKLIALEPFNDKDEKVDATIRKWLFFDPDMQIPRGALVIRVVVSGKPVYLFEIQRRPIKKKGEDGIAKEGEEAFKGLVFVLNDERSLSQWLRTLLNRTRYVKGVVQKLTGSCPGTAHAYKHSTAKDEEVPCEAAVENALRKLGMEI
jgi:hypothetical protein